MAVAALALAVLLGACTSPWQKTAEKSAENMAEKAIEDSSGGQADVDINSESGSISVNTDQGSMQTGQNITLPEEFPDDVYVFEGKLAAVIQDNENNGYSLTIQTDSPIKDIYAAYEENLTENGWEITAKMDFGTTATMAAEKDKRSVSVAIGSGDEENTIIVTVADKEN